MNLSLYLSYIATVVVFLITPGPVTIMVIRQCQGQLRNALLVVLGTNTASVIYIIISLLVMSGLMGLNEQYLNWLQALGALYLIYLGIQASKTLTRQTLMTSHGCRPATCSKAAFCWDSPTPRILFSLCPSSRPS